MESSSQHTKAALVEARGRLGDILIARGKLEPAYLDFALQVQKTSNLMLGEVLVVNNLSSELDVYDAIAYQYGSRFLPVIEADQVDVATAELAENPHLMATLRRMKEHMIVPLRGQRLAVTAPADAHRFFLDFGVREVCVAPPTAILTAIEGVFLAYYEKHMVSSHATFNEETINEQVGMFVDAIIRKAIISRASDIHFELEYPSCYVRYRIDGDLVPQLSYDVRLHKYIANIIMIRSLGNPSNNQSFDDASFEYKLSDTVKASFRVSKVPTELGSAIVLRVLRQDNMLHDLTKLGFLEAQIVTLRRLINRPYGIILVAGPTGSGKSTTLYSLVNELRGNDTKILSIEDPIEINIPFVEQVQVNEKARVTFGTSIRAFLRHDPDVILIGEIRDGETAQMAIESSMTGHIVLSSIHANDTFEVFTRLLDLNVSYRKMASIVGIVAQRLVKRICTACAGKGCPRCNNSGFHGRVVVAELLEFTDVHRTFLFNEDIGGLLAHVRQHGFKTMHKTGLEMVELGITTREEVEKWVAITEG